MQVWKILKKFKSDTWILSGSINSKLTGGICMVSIRSSVAAMAEICKRGAGTVCFVWVSTDYLSLLLKELVPCAVVKMSCFSSLKEKAFFLYTPEFKSWLSHVLDVS